MIISTWLLSEVVRDIYLALITLLFLRFVFWHCSTEQLDVDLLSDTRSFLITTDCMREAIS